jgi:hypothetical protein
MKKTRWIAAAALGLAAPALATTAAGAGHSDDVATYTVTYRNLTDGQYLTPPNFAAHGRDVEVFHVGRTASAGVQAVAENGGVPVLAAELSAALDATGLGISGVGGAAPIGPGGEVQFSFTTDEDHLSIVSMIVCTNDGFAGLDTWKLPTKDGASETTRLRGFDAGTEINTEADTDIVPAPFCADPALGTGVSNPDLAENGKILPHQGILGIGDFDSSYDWQGRVAEVTVTRNG